MSYTPSEIDFIIKNKIEHGEIVYNLATGDPDYPVPPRIIGGLSYAMNTGIHNYSPVAGYQSLRQKIYPNHPTCVIIGNGAKELINLAIQATKRDTEKNEYIVCGPTWSCYANMIRNSGSVVRYVDLSDFTKILQKISNFVNPNTRAIVLNNPNNPTGKIYDPSTIRRLVDMAEKNNFYLIVDEVYEDFIYDKEKTSYMSAQMWPNTIVIKSFSKKYSLTGWRFGYAICGNSIIASKMINIKSNTIGPPNSLIQKAVEYNWDNIIDNRIVDYKARRDYLAESCGWKAPDAGLYFCVPVNDFDKTFKELAKHDIYILSGENYNMPGYARISFANTSLDDLKKIQPILATIS